MDIPALPLNVKNTAPTVKSGIQCPQCDKTVISSTHLKTHIKWVHDLVKDTHMCDYCCKTFSKPGDLRNHQRGHSTEKNFPCHACGKSFKTKYYLVVHTRLHTGEKPFSCDQCGKATSDPSSFKAHMKQHEDGREGFPCSQCGKVLKYEMTLKRHIASHIRRAEEQEKAIFSNEFKVVALKKVAEIGAKETSKLMKVPYSSLRNWISICKGGFLCVDCNVVFPFKASLEQHLRRNKHTLEGKTKGKSGQPVRQ